MDESKTEAVENELEVGQDDIELNGVNVNPQILDVCLSEMVSCWSANNYS